MKRGVKHHHHHRHQQQPYTKCTTPHELKYSHSFYEFLLFCIVLWLWVLLPFVVAAAAAVCIINCQSCADDVFFRQIGPPNITEYTYVSMFMRFFFVLWHMFSCEHIWKFLDVRVGRLSCLLTSWHFSGNILDWEHIILHLKTDFKVDSVDKNNNNGNNDVDIDIDVDSSKSAASRTSNVMYIKIK